MQLDNKVGFGSAERSACILKLEPEDTQRLASLHGPLDSHLKQIEQHFGIVINSHGNVLQLSGYIKDITLARTLLDRLYHEQGVNLTSDDIHLSLQESNLENLSVNQHVANANPTIIATRRSTIKPKGANQHAYVEAIQTQDITFGVGPAGTGKTHLAVACAVAAFEKQQVSRIVLVRPVVEAGEKLGFLPGDLTQKVDPYLRPLYDGLFAMMGASKASKLAERRLIEVAPLAYMRGRTLTDAFIILDEGQNTTIEQMKMFLTRIGFGSTVVVTGDITQIDLPKGQTSGLKHAMNILAGIEGINFTYFTDKDIARHPLIQDIVRAYDRHENTPPKAQT